MLLNEIVKENDLSGNNIEFRESVDSGRSEYGTSREIAWLKNIIAFANSDGGIMYIGVEPRSQKVMGMNRQNTDDAIVLMHKLIRSKIKPDIDYDITSIKVPRSLPAKFIISVSVKPAKSVPVAVHEDGLIGIYLREFGKTVIATQEQIRDMVLMSENTPFDIQGTKIKYRKEEFRELLGEEITEDNLRECGVIGRNGNLTRGGALFRDTFTDRKTRLSAAKWSGIKEGEKADKALELSGNILKNIDGAMDFVSDNSVSDYSEGKFSYPPKAVMEALILAYRYKNYYMQGNAVSVSIFKDRLSISTPGSLMGVSWNEKEKNLSKVEPSERNSVIGDVLRLIGYTDDDKSGFAKIEESYAEYDEKYAPYLISQPGFFEIVLPDLTYKGVIDEGTEAPDVYIEEVPEGKTDIKILSFCYSKERTARQVADYLGIHPSTYFRKEVLARLVADGFLIEREGEKCLLFKSNSEKVKLK